MPSFTQDPTRKPFMSLVLSDLPVSGPNSIPYDPAKRGTYTAILDKDNRVRQLLPDSPDGVESAFRLAKSMAQGYGAPMAPYVISRVTVMVEGELGAVGRLGDEVRV